MQFRQSVVNTALLAGLAGCATGIYGEVAATKLSGTVSQGGMDVDVKTTALGFNVGVEWGGASRRLAIGYAQEALSYDGGGDASSKGMAFRGDFNVMSLSDALKVRLALGLEGATVKPKGGTDDQSVTGLLGGLSAYYALPWDSALNIMLGGVYRSGGGDSASGFTARIAVAHRFGVDHSEEKAEKRRDKEEADPILTRLKNTPNLPPEEIYAGLQKSCEGGNRWGCLFAAVNRTQRDGNRAELAKVARKLLDDTGFRDDALFKYAYAANRCAAEDEWAGCQELKAKMTTFDPWAMASGPSFAKVFPGSTPPDEFPMAALEKYPPGKGWFCFHYSGVVQTITSTDPNIGTAKIEAGNLGCQRTMEACTQMLASQQGNTAITTYGNCVAYEGLLWFYDDGMHYEDEKLCKDQRDLKGWHDDCVPVGTVLAPGL